MGRPWVFGAIEGKRVILFMMIKASVARVRPGLTGEYFIPRLETTTRATHAHHDGTRPSARYSSTRENVEFVVFVLLDV